MTPQRMTPPAELPTGRRRARSRLGRCLFPEREAGLLAPLPTRGGGHGSASMRGAGERSSSLGRQEPLIIRGPRPRVACPAASPTRSNACACNARRHGTGHSPRCGDAARRRALVLRGESDATACSRLLDVTREWEGCWTGPRFDAGAGATASPFPKALLVAAAQACYPLAFTEWRPNTEQPVTTP